MRIRGVLLAAASLFLPRLAFSMTSQEFLLLQKSRRGTDGHAPLYGTEIDTWIQNEYIVNFEPGYTLQQHFESIGMDLSNTTGFEAFSYGYGAQLDDITLNSLVRLDPGVLFVEGDRPAEIIEPVESYTNASAVAEKLKREYIQVDVQHAPYGLQMLAGAGKLSTPISDDGQYDFVYGAGQGVNVYVFDTGIRTSHTLFGGRATHFGGGASGDKSKYTDETNDDVGGHGTHVAGIIGAQKYGVAPYANLISVKVIGKGGTVRTIAQALVDVTAEHSANKAQNPGSVPWRFRGSLINMSLEWGSNSDTCLYQMIAANEAGIAVFAAAGNSPGGKDSSQTVYPCSYPEVQCVGAVDSNYAFDSGYSNYGKVVEYLAPGTDILSLGIEDDESVAFMTGTSMACPHAVGAAAIFVHWQGLINNQASNYVWWNSLDSLISGVPSGTGTLLVNTGIHSPKKYPNEPFRWAGDYPVSNHDVNVLVTTTDVVAVAAGIPLTGAAIESYTTMLTVTAADPGGLHTKPGHTTWDPTIAAPTSTTSVPTQTASPPPPPGGIAGQQVALASYINPLADPDAWSRLTGYNSSKISVLIANVLNGPDSVVDENWQKVISAAISSGKRVIGYVRTGYLGVSQQQFTTRLNSHNLADWVSQIESDVDKWYELYGSEMGGIFFDEGWNDCGPDNIYSDLYAYINAYTKRRYPGAYTVLNPGSTMPQCFENTMDTLLTFESSYESYTSSYTPNDWTPADPRKIWHIIYNVPASAVSTVVALAQQRGAGLVEVTNDVLDNPYDTLPDDAYMQSFMDAVEGGSAPVTIAPAIPDGPAAAIPGSLSVTSSDYSSVSLSWGASADAVGYNVHMNGKQVLSLPSSMTRVTVGMIDPGTSGLSFSVTAIGGGNVESGSSNSVGASTMALPGGKPIINVHAAPQAGFTTYTADILVPYSFVRVYITYSLSTGTCDFQDDPGWPINYNQFSFYCGIGMVENTNLYRYSGTVDLLDGTPNIPWAWTLVGSVPVDQTGYTYTWVVPIGTDTMDTTSFVIQTQGYGPAADVFSPCPSLGGGPTGINFCA